MVPAISRPTPAKPTVASSMANPAASAEPAGSQPSRRATTTSTATCTTSTARTASVLAASRAGRPSGDAPRRFSTPYWRSKPVAIPRPTMAVDMTASARTPGATKSTGWVRPMNPTSTVEKNTSNSTGMPRASSTDSPRRKVRVSSTRVCASTGRISRRASVGGRGGGEAQEHILQPLATRAEVGEGQVVLGEPGGEGRDGCRSGRSVDAVLARRHLGDRRGEARTQRTHVEPGRGAEVDLVSAGGHELGGRAVYHQLTVVDDDHVVGEALGVLQLVGREHDAHARRTQVADDR